MTRARPRYHAPKAPTRQAQRVSAQGIITHHENLDKLPRASLARSHGMTLAEVDAMVAAELKRRALREVEA